MSSSDALNQAVLQLTQALGSENVRTGEDLAGYQDPYGFAEGGAVLEVDGELAPRSSNRG
jgi:hypothetical protein